MKNANTRCIIIKGVKEPLSNIPFHRKAPLTRYMLLSDKLMKNAGFHIAVHLIEDLPPKVPRYANLHAHKCDEINLILSLNETLIYRMELGDQKFEVKSPAAVYIPKGVRHSAIAKQGRGIYIVILTMGDYADSLLDTLEKNQDQ